MSLALAVAAHVETGRQADRNAIAQLKQIDVGEFAYILVWSKETGLVPCGMGLTGIAETETIPTFMKWPCELLRFNPFERVTEASVWGNDCNDEVIDLISDFRHVRQLRLEAARVSLDCLARFKQLHPNCVVHDQSELAVQSD
jgi:hypothetical protein